MKGFSWCRRYKYPKSIAKLNLSYQVWSHGGFTFKKKRTLNRHFPRPAETDPYMDNKNFKKHKLQQKFQILHIKILLLVERFCFDMEMITKFMDFYMTFSETKLSYKYHMMFIQQNRINVYL